jgi:hypothetical protein
MAYVNTDKTGGGFSERQAILVKITMDDKLQEFQLTRKSHQHYTCNKEVNECSGSVM